MFRQYGPQRFRYETIRAGNRERRVEVGTVPIGTIFRAPERLPCGGRTLIVEAWFPRSMGAGRRDHNGRWADSYWARGSFLALVRDLASGRRFQLADHWIRAAVDA
jgi:hypothetical protein